MLDTMFNDTIFYKKDSETEYQKKALEKLEKEFPKNESIKNQIKICNLELKAEKTIERELRNSDIGMYIIEDLNFVYRDTRVQIDYIIITQGYIYLIESKNITGNIKIGEQGEFYRILNGNYTEEIDSPIKQIEKNKLLLKRIWSSSINAKYKEKFEKAYDKSYKAITVFTNPKTKLDINDAPKRIKNRIIKSDKLIPYIKNDLEKISSRKEFIDSKEEMHKQAYRLVDFHIDSNENWENKYRVLFGLRKENIEKEKIEEVKQIKEKVKTKNEKKSNIEVPKKKIKINKQDKVSQIKSVMATSSGSTFTKINAIELKKKLINYRTIKCKENSVTPEYVFTDEEIDIIIEKKPRNVEELSKKKMLTPVRIKMFGKDIIKIINSFNKI